MFLISVIGDKMKTTKLLLLTTAIITASASQATIYLDPAGDEGHSSGSVGAHMDITSIEVTNTTTDITFTFTLTGDPIATNWGKYCIIGRNFNNANLDTAGSNNPWGRDVELLGGSNLWVGSWVDSGGGVLGYNYNGIWNQGPQGTPTMTTNSVSYTVTLADLGLALGDVMVFDGLTTGSNNDPAIDSLTGSQTATWDDHSQLEGLLYTVEAVPEPATMAVLAGAAALAALRRRKK